VFGDSSIIELDKQVSGISEPFVRAPPTFLEWQ
jgi:hypothetical protein